MFRRYFDSLLIKKLTKSISYIPKHQSNNVIFILANDGDSMFCQRDRSVEFNQLISEGGIQNYNFDFRIYTLSNFANFTSSANTLKEILLENPKMIVISAYDPRPSNLQCLSKELIKFLKKHLFSTRIVVIGWDTLGKKYWRYSLSNTSIDTYLAVDNPMLASTNLDKRIRYCCPIPRSISKLKSNTKIYDVWFVGQTSSYRNSRTEYLNALKMLDIRTFLRQSGPGNNNLDNFEYFISLSKSKIALNFSKSNAGFQLKGRVWEIMTTGACLLEERNSQTTQFFTENVHFVAFSNQEEFIYQITYLLKNERLCKKIAASGKKLSIDLQERYSFKNLINLEFDKNK